MKRNAKGFVYINKELRTVFLTPFSKPFWDEVSTCFVAIPFISYLPFLFDIMQVHYKTLICISI